VFIFGSLGPLSCTPPFHIAMSYVDVVWFLNTYHGDIGQNMPFIVWVVIVSSQFMFIHKCGVLDHDFGVKFANEINLCTLRYYPMFSSPSPPPRGRGVVNIHMDVSEWWIGQAHPMPYPHNKYRLQMKNA
jgi:hypothetical protein